MDTGLGKLEGRTEFNEKMDINIDFPAQLLTPAPGNGDMKALVVGGALLNKANYFDRDYRPCAAVAALCCCNTMMNVLQND